MPTTTRFTIILIALALAFALACSEDKSVVPQSEMPSIHPAGSEMPSNVPPRVSAGSPGTINGAAKSKIEAILSNPEIFSRIEQLAALLPTLGPEALGEVQRILYLEDPTLGSAEMSLLARFWALHQPENASRWALVEAPLAHRLSMTLPTFELWAMKDPFSAHEQLGTLGLIGNYDTIAAEFAFVKGWFHSDIPGLEDYVRGLQAGQGRQRALRIMARESIVMYGPQATIEWAEAVPVDDSKFKLSVYRQLGIELAKTHIEYAKSFCLDHCEDPEHGDGLRRFIAQQFARKHGHATFVWLKTAPEGHQKHLAIEWAFRGWMKGDRQALFTWLEDMGPEGLEPWLQPLLELYSVQKGKQDPLRALEWAGSITAPEERRRATRTVATNWHRKHMAAAAEWLETSWLSEEDRALVRKYGRSREELKADGISPGVNRRAPDPDEGEFPLF
ncbi:MAG: hypothetical protein ACI8W3_002219 [Myxococcota bacterium]|jgi:hypothetical protein